MRFLLLCLIFLWPVAASADGVLLKNVRGYTFANGRLETFDALLVRDSLVVAAGAAELLEPYAEDVEIRDLGGASLVPGFVQPHADLRLLEMEHGSLPDALSALAAQGITLAHEAHMTPALWESLSTLGDQGLLDIRIYGMIDGMDDDFEQLSANVPKSSQYRDRLLLRAVHIPTQIEGDNLREPIALRNRIVRAMMRGYQVSVAATDATAPFVLDAYADILEDWPRGGRHRIALQGDLATFDIERAASLGLFIVEKGLSLKAQGMTLERFNTLTFAGARMAYMESRVGSLETGKWADFVILDRDIFDVEGTPQVLETWLAGKAVYPSSRAALGAK